MNSLNGKRPKLKPRLINGKVWIPADDGSYRKLPETDPAYFSTLLDIDSERFYELIEWVYHRNGNGNGQKS
jgi:hypothetical protein